MSRYEYEIARAIESQRAFRQTMQPFWSMKVDIMACMSPVMILHEDGRIDSYYKPPDQVRIDQCDRIIANAQEQTLNILNGK